MSQHRPAPVMDGSTGSLLSRTEPKVKTSTAAALLVTPLANYYVDRLLELLPLAPAEGWPAEVTLPIHGAVTGVIVFVVGYVTRHVARSDV